MPRSTSRATGSQLNSIHRLAAKAIERELKAALKDKTATIAPQLLARAIDFLKMASVTDPEREKQRDTLKGRMPDMDELERGTLHAAPGAAAPSTQSYDFGPPK